MRKAKKQRRNIDKTWLLLVLIPYYKLYKNTGKIKKHLIIVFIRLIKQKLIKKCSFFYKNVAGFLLIISKKQLQN